MKNEVIERMAGLITSAFGMVAALAWNEAVQAAFKQFFGEARGLAAMIGYAILVTVVAVVATVWIGKVSATAKGEK
ncbi:MAG: hypothetical protein KatS3mg105_1154 [Gemmatales bacterium]|nr:MAG: hypothetical protein KatS3mg105_1154 [Gemmatales bacterium]